MKIRVLKAKFKALPVRGLEEKCEGSITIDGKLLDLADIREYEEVFVHGKKSRIRTYVLRGDSPDTIINGNAATHFKQGEIVHVLAFCEMESKEKFSPTIL